MFRSMDLIMSLAEAISLFKALTTPCLWAKRDSSCVGVTTLEGSLIASCFSQSRHVDDRKHLLIQSMDYSMSLAEAISSFEELTTP